MGMRYRRVQRPLEGAAGFFGYHVSVIDTTAKNVYDAVNKQGRLVLLKKSFLDWKGKFDEYYECKINYVPSTSQDEAVRERLKTLYNRLNNPERLTDFNYVNYNHLEYNCEHVANWILTGKWISHQGIALRDIGSNNSLSSFVSVSSSPNDSFLEGLSFSFD
jgi:hypothetical protein